MNSPRQNKGRNSTSHGHPVSNFQHVPAIWSYLELLRLGGSGEPLGSPTSSNFMGDSESVRVLGVQGILIMWHHVADWVGLVSLFISLTTSWKRVHDVHGRSFGSWPWPKKTLFMLNFFSPYHAPRLSLPFSLGRTSLWGAPCLWSNHSLQHKLYCADL